MPNYKLIIDNPALLAPVEITCGGIEQMTLTVGLEADEVFYRSNIDGDLTATNVAGSQSAFAVLSTILFSGYRCAKTTCTIQKFCAGAWVNLYVGIMQIKKVCLSACTIVFSIEQNDIYDCVFTAWEGDVNLYDLPTYSVDLKYIGSVIEQRTCETIGIISTNYLSNQLNTDCFAAIELEFGLPKYYCVKSNTVINTNGDVLPPNIVHTTVWWREVMTFVVPPLDGGWQPTDIANQYWRCPLLFGDIQFINFGRLLPDVIERVVSGTLSENCAACKVVSNFFNINPDGNAPNNTAYNSAPKLWESLLFQKSDVKNCQIPSYTPAGSSGNTAAFNWTLKDMLNDFRNSVNVFWRIEPNPAYIIDPINECPYLFRLEHISYFRSGLLPVTDASGYFYSALCMDIDKGRLPATKTFKWSDVPSGDNWAAFTGLVQDFEGTPILYNPICTEGEKQHEVKTITTNIEWVAHIFTDENGDIRTNDAVSEEGWVWVATDRTVGLHSITLPPYPPIFAGATVSYFVINVEAGNISHENHANEALSFANLHPLFWVDDASEWAAVMNSAWYKLGYQFEIDNFALYPLLSHIVESESVTFGVAISEGRLAVCCLELYNDGLYLTPLNASGLLSTYAILDKIVLPLSSQTAVYNFLHGFNG